MGIEAQDKRRGESRTGWLLVLVCIICHKLSICEHIGGKAKNKFEYTNCKIAEYRCNSIIRVLYLGINSECINRSRSTMVFPLKMMSNVTNNHALFLIILTGPGF